MVTDNYIMNSKIFFVLTLSLFFATTMFGQLNIQVEVSADTIEVGKTVEVKYTIQNGDGRFVWPSLDSLPVISGPNSSSSFMYQNGKRQYSQSFSFVMFGLEEGLLSIPQAKYISGKEEQTIDAMQVVVVNDLSAPQPTSSKALSKSKREKRVY